MLCSGVNLYTYWILPTYEVKCKWIQMNKDGKDDCEQGLKKKKALDGIQET